MMVIIKLKSLTKRSYLGDIIDHKGKNDANITARVKRGHGVIKQILNILEDICFGKLYFIVAKILRESLFLNSILLNSEAWYGLSKSNIEELEKIDNILLKKFFDLPTSTPSVMVHLELGTLPVRYILMTRRVMFLQYILKEDKNSLLSKFLMAQIEETLKGDWWEMLLNDISELRLNYSLHEIRMMSKTKFKTLVKEAASTKAFEWLVEEKLKMTKVKHINHNSLEIQKYLSSGNLNVEQRKFLMHARCRMLTLRVNYKHMHDSTSCPLCSSPPSLGEVLHQDCQEHLLSCKSLRSGTELVPNNLIYSDIFGKDTKRQESMTIVLNNKYKMRKKLHKL